MSTSSWKGGNTVVVYSPHEQCFYRYCHLETVECRAGQMVKSGEKIGTVGHTGLNASMPGHGRHLHLERNSFNNKLTQIVATRADNLKNLLG